MTFWIIYFVVSVILWIIFAGIKIKEMCKKGNIGTDDIIFCVFNGFFEGILWFFTVPFALIAMLAMAVAAFFLRFEDKIK